MSGHDVSFQGSVMMRRSHYVGATNLALCWRCTYRSFRRKVMRKFMMTLAAASLVLGAMALQADAQNGTASLPALKNQSPIVKLAGCRGYTGACGCAPGWVSACRYRCCRCVPC
jgi:hypothetical protein